MQQFNPNNGLPVPCTQIDNRFFNNNLPQGNDAVPRIELSQWMQQNQQIGLMAIGVMRSMAQGAANKSPVHTFVYNMFCQNQFQNQVWHQWCQTVVDFVEFLILIKNYPPQQGIEMAAQRTLESCLGVAYGTYPQLQQVTNQQLAGKLIEAQTVYNAICQDVAKYKAGHFARPMGSYTGHNPGYTGTTGMAPIQVGQPSNGYNGYGNQPPVNNAQVSGYSNISSGHNQPTYNTAGPASGEVANSLYDVPSQEPVAPLVPKEEISNDQSFGQSYYVEQPKMQVTSFDQSTSVVEQTDLPIPTNVNEVVVDPTYYQPNGFKLDINRPFDVVYNPGGVEIRPAQLVQWEITPGDDAPWPQLLDPTLYCLFLVKFPDGTVKEKFVEWSDSMNYLRHELDAELRRKAYRPNGIVVSSATPISTIGGDAVKAEEIESLVKDGHIKAKSVPPVILPTVIMAGNDLEAEATVREELSNLLGTHFNEEVPMPCVEYKSSYVHPIQLTAEAFDELGELKLSKSLSNVAQGLRDMLTQGKLSIRVYRVLNDRLTEQTNAVLKDGMGLTIEIEDFCEDYLSLEDYLEQNRGKAMRTVMQGAGEAILNRAITVTICSNGDDINDLTYAVNDNYYNHQLAYDLADLATLNLKSGKAALISSLAHPVILETLKSMVGRANAHKDTFVGIPRLITRDGYYLELIKGRLVKDAHLLKLVK